MLYYRYCCLGFLAFVVVAQGVCEEPNKRRNELQRRADSVTAMVKSRPRRHGQGTAFCIHPAGYFLTNTHVSGNAGYVYLTLHSGNEDERTVRARIIRARKEPDLALLKTVAPGRYEALDFAGSTPPALSSEVMAFGYSARDYTFDKRVPSVYVSRGTVVSIDTLDGAPFVLKTDLDLDVGNSGGPIVNARGQLVAVVYAGKPGQRLALGIPLNRVFDLIDAPDIVMNPCLLLPGKMDVPVDISFQVRFPRPAKRENVQVELRLRSQGSVADPLVLEKRAADTFGITTLLTSPVGDEDIPFTLFVKVAGKLVKRHDGSIPVLSLDRGLLLHVPFSRGGDELPGIPGAQRGITFKGDPKRVPGVEGSALDLDGIDDCIALTPSPEMGPLTKLSMAFWIRAERPGDEDVWKAAALASSQGPEEPVVWGRLDQEGSISLRRGCALSVSSRGSIQDNTWHHVVMTFDVSAGEMRLYLDGVLHDESGSGGGVGMMPLIPAIGRTGSRPHVYLKARIDELRIYSRILKPGEAVLLANRVRPRQ